MDVENLKTEPVQFFCPTQFKESRVEHAQSSQESKAGHWHHQEISKRASISELTLHNGLPKGEHKTELPGNLRYHDYVPHEKNPYLDVFQNAAAPDTTGELKHHLLDSARLLKHTPVTIQALSKPDVHPPAHPHYIQSYPGGNVNPPQPLRCEPTCVPGQRIGIATPLFPHAEVRSSSHFYHGNSYAPIQHMALSGPSVQCQAPNVALADTSKPTAPPANHHHFYPDGCRSLTEKENRSDGNLPQCHESSEPPKCVPPRRVLVALPVRCADVPLENYSQKANFPVRPILYAVPLHGQSSLFSSHKRDVLGSTRFAESYFARKAFDLVSGNGSPTEFKIDVVPHSSGFPPEANALLPTMPSSYPNYPGPSTSHPASVRDLTICIPHFGSVNDHVPMQSYKIHHSNDSAFDSKDYQQKLANGIDDHKSLVNSSQVVNKQQTSNQRSGDNVKPGDAPWPCNPTGQVPGLLKVEHTLLALDVPDESHDSVTMNEPRCYISVDSKPPIPTEEKNEKNNYAQGKMRLTKNTVPPSEEIVVSNPSHTDSRLSKLETFVVGLETEIHWKKCKPKKTRSESSESETKMKIVSISSTQHQDQFPNDKPSSSSGSDSEDSIGTIRLERVYYSANPCVQSTDDIRLPAKPATPRHFFDCSQSSVFSVDEKLSDVVSSTGKASKKFPAIKKDRNTAKVPGKRKTGDKCTKGDQIPAVKRGRTKKPRNTVKTLLEKQRSMEKAMGDSNTWFKDVKAPGCC